MTIAVPVPKNFRLLPTVHSHGWSILPPFSIRKDPFCLHRIFEVSPRKNVVTEIRQSSPAHVQVHLPGKQTLTSMERRELVVRVRSCLRLDEDFSGFYHEAKRHPTFRWIPKIGAGRMLRSPTVFEDVVKMICTTNCSWALTEVMVRNLCRTFGRSAGDDRFAFPRPEAIAQSTEKFLRKEIRAGYRAPYLLELSRRITRDGFDIESWRSSALPTEELFREVRTVKGVGPYAAGNILKLLGRYDYLGIDSWCRNQFRELYRNGRKTSDRIIEKFYAPFGSWQGLFFWMDVTRHWYEKEFPLS